jgi:hypothetical protein
MVIAGGQMLDFGAWLTGAMVDTMFYAMTDDFLGVS